MTSKPSKALAKRVAKHSKLDDEIRGTLLSWAMSIESDISVIITAHFCKDHKDGMLFYSDILNGGSFMFSDKIRFLRKLLELRYPSILTKYPKLISDLDQVRRLRNKLAHNMTDMMRLTTTTTGLDRIRIIFFEEGKEKEMFLSKEDMDDKLKKWTEIILILSTIKTTVEGS